MQGTINYAGGSCSVSDVDTRFPSWNDNVGESLSKNAKQVAENFNQAQEKLWNQLKKSDGVDPKAFKYESVRAQIEALEC